MQKFAALTLVSLTLAGCGAAPLAPMMSPAEQAALAAQAHRSSLGQLTIDTATVELDSGAGATECGAVKLTGQLGTQGLVTLEIQRDTFQPYPSSTISTVATVELANGTYLNATMAQIAQLVASAKVASGADPNAVKKAAQLLADKDVAG